MAFAKGCLEFGGGDGGGAELAYDYACGDVGEVGSIGEAGACGAGQAENA